MASSCLARRRVSMSKRIILTRRGGFVSIVCPSANCLRWMSAGGRWRGLRRGFLAAQIERSIAAGHEPDATRRFVNAMAFGGCTTAEALGIIRDRDCRHTGQGIELWDASDIPEDRWFRDAWRRSPNGGPIWIDMDAARQIQADRMAKAVASWNFRACQDDSTAALLRQTNGPAIIDLDRPRLRRLLLAAVTPMELKAIWPNELPKIA